MMWVILIVLAVFFFFDLMMSYHIQLYVLFILYTLSYLYHFRKGVVKNYFSMMFMSLFWGFAVAFENFNMSLSMLKYFFYM